MTMEESNDAEGAVKNADTAKKKKKKSNQNRHKKEKINKVPASNIDNECFFSVETKEAVIIDSYGKESRASDLERKHSETSQKKKKKNRHDTTQMKEEVKNMDIVDFKSSENVKVLDDTISDLGIGIKEKKKMKDKEKEFSMVAVSKSDNEGFSVKTGEDMVSDFCRKESRGFDSEGKNCKTSYKKKKIERHASTQMNEEVKYTNNSDFRSSENVVVVDDESSNLSNGPKKKKKKKLKEQEVYKGTVSKIDDECSSIITEEGILTDTRPKENRSFDPEMKHSERSRKKKKKKRHDSAHINEEVQKEGIADYQFSENKKALYDNISDLGSSLQKKKKHKEKRFYEVAVSKIDNDAFSAKIEGEIVTNSCSKEYRAYDSDGKHSEKSRKKRKKKRHDSTQVEEEVKHTDTADLKSSEKVKVLDDEVSDLCSCPKKKKKKTNKDHEVTMMASCDKNVEENSALLESSQPVLTNGEEKYVDNLKAADRKIKRKNHDIPQLNKGDYKEGSSSKSAENVVLERHDSTDVHDEVSCEGSSNQTLENSGSVPDEIIETSDLDSRSKKKQKKKKRTRCEVVGDSDINCDKPIHKPKKRKRDDSVQITGEVSNRSSHNNIIENSPSLPEIIEISDVDSRPEKKRKKKRTEKCKSLIVSGISCDETRACEHERNQSVLVDDESNHSALNDECTSIKTIDQCNAASDKVQTVNDVIADQGRRSSDKQKRKKEQIDEVVTGALDNDYDGISIPVNDETISKDNAVDRGVSSKISQANPYSVYLRSKFGKLVKSPEHDLTPLYVANLARWNSVQKLLPHKDDIVTSDTYLFGRAPDNRPAGFLLYPVAPKLEACGLDYIGGRWSLYEEKQLMKNVIWCCKFFGWTVDMMKNPPFDGRHHIICAMTYNIRRAKRYIWYKFLRLVTEHEKEGPYSAEDIEDLFSLHDAYGNNWVKIGEKMGRGNNSASKKYNRLTRGGRIVDKDSVKKIIGRVGGYTEEETKKLMEAVDHMPKDADGNVIKNKINWFVVAAYVGTRSDLSCRDQWLRRMRAKRTAAMKS